MNSKTGKQQITGLILAGGAGRRARGRDKGLIQWHGKPLVEHVIKRLDAQVGQLLISCNRNIPEYARFGVPVVTDLRTDFQGPLAGLEGAARLVETEFVVVVACDIPLLPPDLVPRLIAPLVQAGKDLPQLSYAHDGSRAQYLCAAMRRECLFTLGEFLEQGHRAVRDWYARHRSVMVDFSDQSDAFANFNELPQ